MELLVHPFQYSEAAKFWGADDPELAVLLHSIVGGTPAYRREFVAFDAPDGRPDFDSWVARTVLNSQSPLFREARYLLAEETEIRDPALYHSVLAAIAAGNRTNGGIANFVGRKSAEITHPLNVLEDCALISKDPDVFRRPEWFRLEAGGAEDVWRDQRPDFLNRVVGPHFETICRDFTLRAGRELFGEPVATIGSGVVNDPVNKTQIEIDVAVLGPAGSGGRQRILSLGEVKWGTVMSRQHVERLAAARDLLSSTFDTTDCVLACYSAAGFDTELRTSKVPRTLLVTLNDIYPA